MDTSSGQGRPSRHRDRGETLIELLATIMIMGIGVTAILGAVGMGITGSARVRSDSTLVAAMRSYGEALANISDADYVSCALTSSYSPAVTLPTGTTVSVSRVEVWDGVAYQPSVTGCSDQGLQRITLTGRDTRITPEVTGSLVVYVRKPCTTNTATC